MVSQALPRGHAQQPPSRYRLGCCCCRHVKGMTPPERAPPVPAQIRRPQLRRTFSPSATVKAVGFDGTYRTDDGVAVQIIEIEEAKLGPFPETEGPDAKEGDP